MAVYTRIEPAEAQRVIDALAPGQRVTALEPLPQGSINTTYRLSIAAGERVYLRVNENKSADMVAREVAVVNALARARLPIATPALVAPVGASPVLEMNLPGGRGARRVMLFRELPGVEIGPEAVTPAHTRQVGAFMARAHAALRHLGGALPNRYSDTAVTAWLTRLSGHPRLADVGVRLSRTLTRAQQGRRPMPRGVIHGDLFINNSRWEGERLVAVFDWEMAGRDVWLRDVAIAFHAWCFRAGSYHAGCAAALLAGYQSVRPLTRVERAQWYPEAQSSAVRFCASRIVDFELNTEGDRAFLDYRDYLARLDALEQLGPRGLSALVGM